MPDSSRFSGQKTDRVSELGSGRLSRRQRVRRRHRQQQLQRTRNQASPHRFESLEDRLLLATVSLPAIKDNTLYETADGNLSNGAGDHIFAGSTNDGNLRRAVIAFDPEGGGIPEGATVTDVQLELTVSKSRLGSRDTDIALHQLLKDWGEGSSHADGEEGAGDDSLRRDATWVHTFWDSTLWDAPGGDFEVDASAIATVGTTGTTASWSGDGLVEDVQQWVDDPDSNFGWILIGDESAAATTRRFWSKDSISGLNPRLEVTFTLETLTLELDDQAISENSGQTMGRVTRTNSSGDLTVTLMSDDTSEATIIDTIVIPDGEMVSADFPVTAVDDAIVDGTQTVSLTATASGHIAGVAQLSVTDFEELTVTILDDAISENGGTTTLVVSRVDTVGNLTINLATSDDTEATVVTPVVIANGASTSDPITITAVDDDLVDGTQTVTVTASANGYESGGDSLDVLDFEQLELELSSVSINEGGTVSGIVRRTDASGDLTLDLQSSDLSEATIVGDARLLADGSLEFPFEILAIQDGIVDGTQEVTITASAPGYETATATLDVSDFGPLVVEIADSSISEAGGQTTARVTRANAIGIAIVTLASDDTSEASVPGTVIIPDGETTSEPFTITGVDDDELDGPATVIISAEADGYGLGTATLEVTDFEQLNVSINAAAISERGGTTTATVSRPNTSGDLVVTLASDDTTAARVGRTVLIADGQTTSPAFTVNAVDDAIVDGTQTVNVLASAPGYVTGSDSIDVQDFEQLVVVVANSPLSENGGATTATVTRTDPRGNLVVTLASSNPARATVPETVLIADGEVVSAPFDVQAVDDDLLNGPATITITGSAENYVNGTGSVVITDFEQLVVTLAENSISENGGTTTGTVRRTSSSGSLRVTLASDKTDEATVVTTVTIPDGQQEATFQVAAQDDDLLDGPQAVTISASAQGHVTGTAQLEVSDFEQLSLNIGASMIREPRGSSNATVSRAGTSGTLIVQLTSSDTSEATVPQTVTIPNGVSSRNFLVRVADDSELDGNQVVTVTATAVGYIEGSDTVVVADDETTTTPLLPTRDNTLYQDPQGDISNGKGEFLFVGRTNQPANSIRRGVIAFDLAQASIPAGSIVTQASLRMTVSQAPADGSEEIQLRRLTQPWGEGNSNAPGQESNGAPAQPGDATWLHTFFDGSTWTSPGGDFVDSVSATATVGGVGSTAVWTSAELLADVQRWLESPTDNHGWILLGNETEGGTSRRFDSGNRSGATPPVLSVTFAPPTEQLTMTAANSSVSENAGTTQVTLSRSGSTDTELTVFLTSGDTTELSVPASVVIPAGQSSATFTATGVDDAQLDGAQPTAIQAVAAGFQPGTTTIRVLDFEPLTLNVAQTVLTEGGATTTATVTRIDAAGDLAVTLSSSDVTEAIVPLSVTIPAGRLTSDPFTVRPVNDFLLDGTQVAQITAAAMGYASSSQAVQVLDDDTTSVRIVDGELIVVGSPRVDSLTVRTTGSDLVLIDPVNKLATGGANGSPIVAHEVTVPLDAFPNGARILAAEGRNSLTFDAINSETAGQIRFRGGASTDTVRVLGAGLSLDIGQFEKVDLIDISGNGDNQISVHVDGVLQNIDGAGDGVIIRSDLGDEINFDAGWTLVSSSSSNGEFFRVLVQGDAQVFLDGPAHWQNPLNRFDVNNDGVVSAAGDILPSVNQLNFGDVIDDDGRLPQPPTSQMLGGSGLFYDIDGNGFLTPRDILGLVNFLNAQSGAEGEGEGAGERSGHGRVASLPMGIAGLDEPVLPTSETSVGGEVTLIGTPRHDPYWGQGETRSAGERQRAIDKAVEEFELDELVLMSAGGADDAGL